MTDRGPSLRSLLRTAALSTLAAVAVTACGESVTQVGADDIVEVRLSADTAVVVRGGTVQLRALPLDSTGALLVTQDFTWTTGDATIATVDDAGLVTGVAVGTTEVTVTVAGLEARAVVSVLPLPELVLTPDTVAFSSTAGTADPATESVTVTNNSVFPLLGLAIDSVVYGAAAQDWLTPQLLASAAPTTLELSPMLSGLTTAGQFVATVWLSGIDASNNPAPLVVTLDIAAGAAASMAVNGGNAQSAAVGTAVATPPSVLVLDDFGNPVAGTTVTFTVTTGGGSLTGATAVSGADGIARAGSWTLGSTAGANTASASATGLTSVAFTATGTAGAASQLQLDGGDNQGAIAGGAVPNPPSVTVLDQFGNGVSGIAVAFAVTAGGGSVTGGDATSDASGVATVGSWTLGTSVGTNTLQATSAGIADTVTFTATALSGTATMMSLAGGDAQTDTVGATLGTPYTVLIVDTNANPVAGIPVTWTVTGGGGSVTSSSVSGSDGIATATRILGTTAGAQTATASVGGLTGSPVAFGATATVGAPVSIAIVAGDTQTATVATAVGTAPSVVVADQFGNPVPGESITFSVTGGGGTVTPTSALVTNAAGIATVTSWTVGTAAGTNNNTLSALAASASITGNPIAFTASATAGAIASISQVSGAGQTAVTGLNVANPPTVLVTDAFANPIAGAGVTFSASGGGSVGTASATTNGSGVAMTTWTVSETSNGSMTTTGTYTNTLTATAQGTAFSTQFSGSARYSFVTHVNPIFSGCTGCHGGSGGLTFSTTSSAANYAALVDVAAGCDGTTGYRRVSPVGGVDGADVFSILMRLRDSALTNGTCWSDHPSATAGSAELTRIRGWIRNGAPNN